jgi:hypothetical protein
LLAAIEFDDNGLEQHLKLGVIQILERPREIVWEMVRPYVAADAASSGAL